MARQNPVMEALGRGAAAQAATARTGLGFFNSAQNAINSSASIALKMDALLQEEEARKQNQLLQQQAMMQRSLQNAMSGMLTMRGQDMRQQQFQQSLSQSAEQFKKKYNLDQEQFQFLKNKFAAEQEAERKRLARLNDLAKMLEAPGAAQQGVVPQGEAPGIQAPTQTEPAGAPWSNRAPFSADRLSFQPPAETQTSQPDNRGWLGRAWDYLKNDAIEAFTDTEPKIKFSYRKNLDKGTSEEKAPDLTQIGEESSQAMSLAYPQQGTSAQTQIVAPERREQVFQQNTSRRIVQQYPKLAIYHNIYNEKTRLEGMASQFAQDTDAKRMYDAKMKTLDKQLKDYMPNRQELMAMTDVAYDEWKKVGYSGKGKESFNNYLANYFSELGLPKSAVDSATSYAKSITDSEKSALKEGQNRMKAFLSKWAKSTGDADENLVSNATALSKYIDLSPFVGEDKTFLSNWMGLNNKEETAVQLKSVLDIDPNLSPLIKAYEKWYIKDNPDYDPSDEDDVYDLMIKFLNQDPKKFQEQLKTVTP